jgi:hypothetical protein
MIRKLGLAAETIAILMIAAFFAASAAAQSATPASLEDQLKAQYKHVKLGSAGQSVIDPGTILVIQKGGLVGVPLFAVCPSTYKDEVMHSPNAFCLVSMRNYTRDLTVGEKVYVDKIAVDEKKDRIELEVVECDSCNGNRSSYKSKIAFQFSKGQLARTDVAKVTDVIGEVFSTDRSGDTAQQAQNTQRQQSVSEAPRVPAQPIQVGQTLEQVKAITGDELKLITDLGDTKIYRYDSQRIKFENGKVTEIQ